MIRVLDSAGSTLVEWGRQQQQQDAVFQYPSNRAYWSCGQNISFWIQMLTVHIQTSIYCVLEQDTLSALLQKTQL